MRTPADIVTEMHRIASTDLLGYQSNDLLRHLPFDDARPFLIPEATADAWKEVFIDPSDAHALNAELAEAFAYSYEKASNHRGISANIAIDRVRVVAWLLGRDDVVAAMDQADYQNYGMPKAKAACDVLGIPFSTDDGLIRMARGEPCSPDGCSGGCGS